MMFSTPLSARRSRMSPIMSHMEPMATLPTLMCTVQRGGLKRLDLGLYVKVEQARRACERHYATGCDLSKAKKITD
jgi:hypothetical protein